MNSENHYRWLGENLNDFWIKVTGKSLQESGCAGIISAHGDKCYSYRTTWDKAGIRFPQGVAIYLLSYIEPFCQEVRHTKNGWVSPGDWVTNNYNRFKDFFISK